jgi:hypothetical protein
MESADKWVRISAFRTNIDYYSRVPKALDCRTSPVLSFSCGLLYWQSCMVLNRLE